ncbi:MAG: mechanosensitive ion channel family protein [Pseudomonadota bacterium]
MNLKTFLPLACLALLAFSAAAEGPPDVSEEAVQSLVDTLENDDARAKLIDDLKLLMAAQETTDAVPAPDLVASLGQGMRDIGASLAAVPPQRIVEASVLSLLVVIVALLLRWLLLRACRRLYSGLYRGSGGSGEEGGEAGADAQPLPTTLSRLVTLLIAVLAGGVIAQSLGVDVLAMRRTEVGARIIDTVLSVGIILLVAVAAWHAARIAITRALMFGVSQVDAARSARRLDTLRPLLLRIAQAIIGVLTVLVVLAELGVNIGPLLAGAGIVGLAVGFGAQTLVKDLITGVLILMEDGASVGDVIEVSGHSGRVEDMRIRSLQLRDVSGAVHLVPYSEVTTIKNLTKDFSYYVLDVGVAYREDTDAVCEALRAVDEELRADDPFKADILEPLEILGVNQFADSAVVIRARLKPVPAQQWSCGREFNRRMKKRFDELGIEIPFPHTTLYFGEPKSGAAPPVQVAMAAGQASS